MAIGHLDHLDDALARRHAGVLEIDRDAMLLRQVAARGRDVGLELLELVVVASLEPRRRVLRCP